MDLSWISKDVERIDARSVRHVFVNEYPDGSLGHVAWSFKNEASDYTIDGVKPARQIQFVEVIR